MALSSTEEAQTRALIAQQAAILSLASSEPTIISKLAATKVSLADLTAATSLSDTDLFLVRQGTTEKSVAKSIISPTISDASETVKGIVELATSAETLTGTDNTRAVHPAGLMSGFVKSFAANGYQKLPSGLIIQWGSVAPASRSGEFDFGNITLPISFPVACVGGYATVNHNGTVQANVDSFAAVTVSTSTINIKSGSNISVTWTYGVFWIAIGY